MPNQLTDAQRSVLFSVFIAAFSLITVLTIWGVFFGLPGLNEEYKKALFGALLLEIISVVVVLFKAGFLSTNDSSVRKKVWIDIDEEDVKNLIGKQIIISPRDEDGSPLKESFANTILDDRGLYVAPVLPHGTYSVFAELEIEGRIFEGSLSIQSYALKLQGEEQ